MLHLIKKYFLKQLFFLVILITLQSCNNGKKSLVNIVNSKNFIAENKFVNLPNQNIKKIKVALFLPLSGKHQQLGNSLANSAIISLFENKESDNLELLLFDSGDNLKDAEKSFSEIVKQEIKIVIGPLFSSIIPAIEKTAFDNKMIIFSLSNNSKMLSKLNESLNNNQVIFISGISPDNQFKALIDFSNQNNYYNFIMIAPNNEAGRIMNDAFRENSLKKPNNFESYFYKSDLSDIENIFFPFGKNKNRKELNLSKKILVIADSPKNISKIINFIAKNNKNFPSQVFGTSQLDDIATFNENNLQGLIFANSEPQNFQNFEQRYYDIFKSFPPRISSLAYDLTNAIAKVANQSTINNKEITIGDFINYSSQGKIGFEGIDGYYQFNNNGSIKRNIAIIKVDRGKFTVIKR